MVVGMRRRRLALALAGALLLVLLVGSPARARRAPGTTAPPPTPTSFVLVDADTGAVIAQQDARSLHRPASTIKLLTALIAAQQLAPSDPIPISAYAEGMPARKINVKANQVWTFDHLLHSMMMVSANDAAVAIGEKLGGGSLDGYVTLAQQTADRLGLADHPQLNDPAGLDDEFAYKGGSQISARDLAIVGRAVLADPALMQVIATRDYHFTGGDGLPHKLTNHDLFLDLYPGANGLKTGTTDLAGHTFVGSATRGGRTMLAVVFDAVDYYGSASQLLDQGFATPVSAEANLDHLPAVVPDASKAPVADPAPLVADAASVPVSHASHDSSMLESPVVAIVVLVVGLVPLFYLRRRVIGGRQASD